MKFFKMNVREINKKRSICVISSVFLFNKKLKNTFTKYFWELHVWHPLRIFNSNLVNRDKTSKIRQKLQILVEHFVWDPGLGLAPWFSVWKTLVDKNSDCLVQKIIYIMRLWVMRLELSINNRQVRFRYFLFKNTTT